MNPTIKLWVPQNKNVWVPPNVGPIRISHESMWVPHVGPTQTYCGSRMKQYMWMIRAIHARSDGSRFVDDVAQCGGKNPPTLCLVKILAAQCPSVADLALAQPRRSRIMNYCSYSA
jgi:hypothetical protein